MVRITRELLRKKAEHHEDILPTLEELSLHQLEIEKIEVVGDICRKLKILYLQNNIIAKIEGLSHCKDMEYLNLALNNITRIEGLRTCEFLNKLDLTVNFIDMDTFEDSISELRYNRMLKELYLMGNPAADWEGHRHFVAAALPQLHTLDGKEITRTERILAHQRLPQLVRELREGAAAVRVRKLREAGLPIDEEAHHPANRVEMYREVAEEKKEKEDRENEMKPKKRDYASEHENTVQEQRKKERELGSEVRQCNQGRYEFRLEDEDGEGNVTLTVHIPRFIDTSLIDVDVQPTYVSVIVKNKTLRLSLPEEVKPDKGKAERSQTTGHLKLTLPKLDTSRSVVAYRAQQKAKEEEEERKKNKHGKGEVNKREKLGETLLREATGGVSSLTHELRNIVRQDSDGKREGHIADAKAHGQEDEESLEEIDDSDVPPLE
eukprot:g3825.t1